MAKFYAGIGSRETPPDVESLMQLVATSLEHEGWTLRSGGAKGADSAFERGAKTLKEIYIPWQGFRSRYQTISGGDGIFVADRLSGWSEALKTVKQFHPAPHRLSREATMLMARNAMQVLGPEVTCPGLFSSFVLCWTLGGEEVGGTSQAIRIAKSKGIPVYNLGSEGHIRSVTRYLETGQKFYEN